MKKVFLVDDEIEVREGIRQCIDWTEEGFVYCGDAPDGELALPLIESIQPDIVITDIRMPFMDGLQLSRLIRHKMPLTKIIILSGHDEFEYAREALRIHVHEYCLKPLSSTDLLFILHQTSEQIDRESIANKKIDDLLNQAHLRKMITQDQLLNHLCHGTLPIAELIDQARLLDIDLVAKFYQIILIEGDEHTLSHTHHLLSSYNNICFARNNKETVYIVKGDSEDQLEHQASLIKACFIEEAQHRFAYFGFGGIKNRLQHVADSFAEADEEKSFQSIVHKFRKTMLSEPSVGTASNTPPRIERDQLIEFLKFGNATDIDPFLHTFMTQLNTASIRNSFYTYYFMMEFTIVSLNYINDLESENGDIIDEINRMESQLSWMNDNEKLITYLQKLLQLVIVARQRSGNRFASIIQKAQHFINANYNQDISLHIVAQHVNVSPSYFSHIFSQEVNRTFTEYLTQIRMNKAMELLRTTHDKAYEIAHKVGYSDPHYFCHLFKKFTGLTTTEFKANN